MKILLVGERNNGTGFDGFSFQALLNYSLFILAVLCSITVVRPEIFF